MFQLIVVVPVQLVPVTPIETILSNVIGYQTGFMEFYPGYDQFLNLFSAFTQAVQDYHDGKGFFLILL